MPAQKDDTAWQPTEGDHADDQSYERVQRNPEEAPTDEQRTAEDIERAAQENKQAAKENKGD